jgi:hypothetical protein
MDFVPLAKKIVPTRSLRIRQGKVTLINNDRTVNVTVGDLEGTLPNVKYLSSFPPKIDDQIWFVTDGVDMIGLGHIAAANRTLAPVAYRTSSLTITKDTNTYVPFQAVSNDAWDCWDVGSATVLTAPITGTYIVTGSILFTGQNNAYVSVFLEKGTQEIARQDGTMSTKEHGFHASIVSQPISLTKGDTVRMGVHHDHNPTNDLILSSGGVDHTGYFNSLSFHYIGP